MGHQLSCARTVMIETHVVWMLDRQLLALGSGVVTVLVRLRALPSPLSRKPKTSKAVPSAIWRVKSYSEASGV